MKSESVIILIICCLAVRSVEYNDTSPDVSGVLFSTVDDGSEQELSAQLERVNDISEGWSGWSRWTPCSRSCDGGISRQLRTCTVDKCRGKHVQYRICNTQACPDPHDFREDQCATYNNIPLNGILYEWVPHYMDNYPCALICKGRPIDLDESNEDFVAVVENFSNKVLDGTRCRPGSLDVCIGGDCQQVGCDLQIGSEKQVDECGVCGGDGSTCSRSLYHWILVHTSLCSATCGGGYKVSYPKCQNRDTGDEVEEKLCNESQKPDRTIVECNTQNCPPKWHTNKWGPCSVSCGRGIRHRQVQCVVQETNNTKLIVDDTKCEGPKPWFQEDCNEYDCPTWVTTTWSGCSVSCGEGTQVRNVECRDKDGRYSELCLFNIKPISTKLCSTGIQCPTNVKTSEELLPGLYHINNLVQLYPPAPIPERLIGDQIVPSESTFISDEWGPCTVTCGEGVRRREVHCKIFLEYSRTIAKLPDKQCSGPKPIETQSCYKEPCVSEKIGIDIKDDPYSRADIKIAPGVPGKSYSWKEQGYTQCSATCLGGIQELIVNCVRDDTQKLTSPYMCPIELKPEIRIQTCNDHPCPPRWNYSNFSQCSQSCGIGIQTREVNCIHEVTQGGGNTVIVPNNMCPQPPPPDRQYCNVLDCPVKWKIGEWSRCSTSCGGGSKTRKVECKQVMAQNHTVDRPPSMCSIPKPAEFKPCNTKSCIVESDKPHIDVSNSTFIQHDPKKKKISLKVGGAATVFSGTTIKIKCPVKRFDRTKIEWMKDKSLIPRNRKYKTSKKGALRVTNLTLRDSGMYTCMAAKSVANIHISVRPKPGEFPTSEEIQKQGLKTEKVELASDVHEKKEEETPIFSDDHSHEQRPDRSRKNPSSKLFTPTLPSLRLDPNYNEQLQSSLNRSGEKDPSPHLPSSTSQLYVPDEHTDLASSASRVLPNFQKLIFNLQAFSNSRGHRMIDFPSNKNNENRVPFLNEDSEESDYDTKTEKFLESSDGDNIVVLGKGKKENLKFEWTSGPWSRCSETCGGNGIQRREVSCIVKLYNASQPVDNILCDETGVKSPFSIRKCGFDRCPEWTVHEWSSCENSKCFKWHKALQRRIVSCEISSNITLDPVICDADNKPSDEQECVNKKCVGKWKIGRWSDCAATCESKGLKYRIIQCVWYGTKKSAGDACKGLPRPQIIKPCVGIPCSTAVPTCQDHSLFCSNVRMMNMCKVMRYQQQCCQTCKL
ncbi:protein madd-4 isoform X2 [Diorhabda carinulata]|uniref:protein madd-4 isoform X2 n=1 Tax=Diorhabda carinulata TaxID=1163345 RepID=UPI0025A1CFA2|nr:protein madd-4 isoform X2 [Diorhabda carinulata]